MKSKMITVKVSDLKSAPWNPRKHFDQALVEDIASDLEAGKPLIQAPSVWRDGDSYIVIAGNTRVEAVRKAKIKEISVVEWECTREEAMVMTFKENEQRADVYPIQQAMLVANIFGSGRPVDEIVRSTGLKKSSVYDYIAISKRVHPDIIKLAEEHPSCFTKSILMELTGFPQDAQAEVSRTWSSELESCSDDDMDEEWSPDLRNVWYMCRSLKGCKFAGPGSKCSSCPMNSANIGVLPGFENADDEVEAKCYSNSCYQEMDKAWRDSVVEKRLAKVSERRSCQYVWNIPPSANQKKATAENPCAYYAWDNDKLVVKYGPSKKAEEAKAKSDKQAEKLRMAEIKRQKNILTGVCKKVCEALNFDDECGTDANNRRATMLIDFFGRVQKDGEVGRAFIMRIAELIRWWFSYNMDEMSVAGIAEVYSASGDLGLTEEEQTWLRDVLSRAKESNYKD